MPTSDRSLRIRCFMGDGSCKTVMPLIGRYQVAALSHGTVAIRSMWSAIICFTKALQYLILKSFHLDTEYTHGSLCLTGLDTRDSRRRNQSLFNTVLVVNHGFTDQCREQNLLWIGDDLSENLDLPTISSHNTLRLWLSVPHEVVSFGLQRRRAPVV